MGHSQIPHTRIHTMHAHTFFSKILLFSFMYAYACRGWDKALGPLKLELEVVVSHLIQYLFLTTEPSSNPTQTFSTTTLCLHFFFSPAGVRVVQLEVFVLTKFSQSQAS